MLNRVSFHKEYISFVIGNNAGKIFHRRPIDGDVCKGTGASAAIVYSAKDIEQLIHSMLETNKKKEKHFLNKIVPTHIFIFVIRSNLLVVLVPNQSLGTQDNCKTIYESFFSIIKV